MSHWLLILAIATFLCVIAFLAWNKRATTRHQQTTDPNDPQSASGNEIRPPEELRASLDAAASTPHRTAVSQP